jgi:hypothetical protein
MKSSPLYALPLGAPKSGQSFAVKDANGVALAYVYFEDEPIWSRQLDTCHLKELANRRVHFPVCFRPSSVGLGKRGSKSTDGIQFFGLRLFRVSIRSLAAGPDEAGFWPVISWPSATV